MIRCVVFDFDGTLVLSNGIKREGFLSIAAEWPNGRAVMQNILASPPGDRSAILGTFADACGGDAESMVTTYSAWCEEHILTCPERRGATSLLLALREAGFRIYINSATPTMQLRTVVALRYPDGIFNGVFGGHGKKLSNLLEIMAEAKCGANETLVIGDGDDDRQAAAAAGCYFKGIAEGTLAASGWAGPMLTDFVGYEIDLIHEALRA